MRHYKNITYYENRRRLEILNKFRDDVTLYFDNSRYEGSSIIPTENEEAKNARQKINRTLSQVRNIVHAADIVSELLHVTPQYTRNHIPRFDVLKNVCDIWRWNITNECITDFLNQAIGVYESDRKASICRTFNPVWWAFRTLVWVAYVPLRILGGIGFDLTKMEQSALGKLSKLVFPIAAFLTILHLMGWLDTIKRVLGVDP